MIPSIGRTFYWVSTGLMTVFMLLGAIPDLLAASQAVVFFEHLGYPAYLLPFLGTAKCLGIGAVVMPVPPRLKEWAFAGLIFDVSGALYSHISVGDPASVVWFPFTGLALITAAYVAYRSQATDASASSNEGPLISQPHTRRSA
jgi:hypothetical protein